MKKLISLFLASLLSLSLFTFGPVTPMPPQGLDPIPMATVQPEELDKPGEPPVEPQDDLPDPKPITKDIS